MLTLESLIHAELDALERKLRAARRKKDKRAITRLKKRIAELHRKLNEME